MQRRDISFLSANTIMLWQVAESSEKGTRTGSRLLLITGHSWQAARLSSEIADTFKIALWGEQAVLVSTGNPSCSRIDAGALS